MTNPCAPRDTDVQRLEGLLLPQRVETATESTSPMTPRTRTARSGTSLSSSAASRWMTRPTANPSSACAFREPGPPSHRSTGKPPARQPQSYGYGKTDSLSDKPLFGDASQHLAGLGVIFGCTLIEVPLSADMLDLGILRLDEIPDKIRSRMLGFHSFSSTLRMKRYSYITKPPPLPEKLSFLPIIFGGYFNRRIYLYTVHAFVLRQFQSE